MRKNHKRNTAKKKERRPIASDVTFGDELLFPSEYLASADLDGKDTTLTIGSISKQELRVASGGKKAKPVIEFKPGLHPGCFAGKKKDSKCICEKKFVLNVTNCDTIRYVTGERAAEKWIGHAITFFVGRTHSPKGIVDCLRIREKKPEAPKDQPKQETKKEPPKPPTIPQGWIDAAKKADSVDRLGSLHQQASAKWGPTAELTVQYGEILDARKAEIEAEAKPDEPKGDLQ